jgi:hypothetical protein
MPPKKKSKTDEASSASATLTPKDAYFKRLDQAIDDNGCKGSMIIVGIKSDNGSSDEDEGEDDSKEYTEEQIGTLRHILINDSRDKALEKAHDFASCGGDFMFTTKEGNFICHGIPGEIKKALKQKTQPARFDTLFALTHSLKRYNYWMNDNECWREGEELEQAIKALAKAWKDMLKKSDAELGIDSEFTRPGIEALLEELSDDFEGCDPTSEFPFEWRA